MAPVTRSPAGPASLSRAASTHPAVPPVANGDLLVIHDTGAHGHAMGFNYNGKLRPQELLLRQDGQVELIRRAETVADYMATLSFEPRLLRV